LTRLCEYVIVADGFVVTLSFLFPAEIETVGPYLIFLFILFFAGISHFDNQASDTNKDGKISYAEFLAAFRNQTSKDIVFTLDSANLS
jgi:hypothetical protein